MESKRIVITGCTKGLGLAMTREFLGRGHEVYGCGRSLDKIETLRNEFASADAHFETLDITDDEAVHAWASRILGGPGAPDFLINNAALINRPSVLWELDAAEIDPVFDVNLKGICNTIRHFVPGMIAAGAGVIVNFSSGWGRSTSPEVAPYCATKYGVEGLTAALAQELPSGLAAVALNPGIIDTEMLRDAFGESAGNYPSPEEWVARAAPMILGFSESDNGGSLSV